MSQKTCMLAEVNRCAQGSSDLVTNGQLFNVKDPEENCR